MASVLIVDDDRGMCRMLAELIERMGHRVHFEHTLGAGLARVRSHPYDVVFLDVHMPDGNGLDMLPEIRKAPSRPEVIIITGFGTEDGAELAIRNGAWDYIQKSDSPRKVLLPLQRVLQYREEVKKTRSRPVALRLGAMTGTSAAMQACFDLLARAAASEVNVLITGETGTGKELMARAVHENSARASRNFVVVDCAALPDTLVEGLLFGYRKGVYTGADRNRDGLILEAHGGTLFLDEVGELPPTIQKVFLRVLQERRFRPLGSREEQVSDFRLVAASNRDLDAMVRSGRFRGDLLHRLRGLEIRMPPLRDRVEDIRPLVLSYVDRVCRRRGMGVKGFSPDFFELLTCYPWPGNVRELFHAVEAAMVAAGADRMLFSKHLPEPIRIHAARISLSEEGTGVLPGVCRNPQPRVKPPLPPLKEFRKAAVAQAERDYLRNLLSAVRGDIREACRRAKVSRSRLYELLKAYGIAFPT